MDLLIGEKIKRIRRERDLTQEEAAAHLGEVRGGRQAKSQLLGAVTDRFAGQHLQYRGQLERIQGFFKKTHDR